MTDKYDANDKKILDKANIFIQFNFMGAVLSKNEKYNLHPKRVMEELGVKVLGYSGQPIADCVLMIIDHIPENLPDFIDVKDFDDKTKLAFFSRNDWSGE